MKSIAVFRVVQCFIGTGFGVIWIWFAMDINWEPLIMLTVPIIVLWVVFTNWLYRKYPERKRIIEWFKELESHKD